MMRKVFVFLGLCALVLLAFSGCASGAAAAAAAAPDWYLNPPHAEDAVYGVGSAKMATLDMSRTMALSRARDDVARQVQVMVKNCIKDYAQQAGSGDEQQTLNFSENVSLQISNQTLNGVKTEKIVVGNDGTVFAMVSTTANNLKTQAKQVFAQNESAAFANYKADQAMDFLDKQIEKNAGK